MQESHGLGQEGWLVGEGEAVAECTQALSPLEQAKLENQNAKFYRLCKLKIPLSIVPIDAFSGNAGSLKHRRRFCIQLFIEHMFRP